MMQKALNDNSQIALRKENIISESEIAYSIGDKYVAENILTRTRREIQIPATLLESNSNKRILKG